MAALTTRQRNAQLRRESAERMAAAHLEAYNALHSNTCPRCGQGVHANLALYGWVQCDGYGAEGFRKAGASACSWQGFTE